MNTRETFLKRINKVGECWEWTGKLARTGYGYFCIDGVGATAHRHSYLMFKGDIPKGYHVDHLCRNRACVNPDHLEAVTPRENVIRGISPLADNAKKTECMRGHEFTGENTKITQKGRTCGACLKDIQAKYNNNHKDIVAQRKKDWWIKHPGYKKAWKSNWTAKRRAERISRKSLTPSNPLT